MLTRTFAIAVTGLLLAACAQSHVLYSVTVSGPGVTGGMASASGTDAAGRFVLEQTSAGSSCIASERDYGRMETPLGSFQVGSVPAGWANAVGTDSQVVDFTLNAATCAVPGGCQYEGYCDIEIVDPAAGSGDVVQLRLADTCHLNDIHHSSTLTVDLVGLTFEGTVETYDAGMCH